MSPQELLNLTEEERASLTHLSFSWKDLSVLSDSQDTIFRHLLENLSALRSVEILDTAPRGVAFNFFNSTRFPATFYLEALARNSTLSELRLTPHPDCSRGELAGMFLRDSGRSTDFLKETAYTSSIYRFGGNFPALTALELSGDLFPSDRDLAHRWFCLMPNLSSLILSNCNISRISESEWGSIGLTMSTKRLLRSLTLSNNQLNKLPASHWQKLGQGLGYESKLESLNLDGNHFEKLSELQWGAVRFLLSGLKQLKALHLGNGALWRPRERLLWQRVGLAIAVCLELEYLNLEGNRMDVLSERHWQAMGLALSGNATLRELRLANNGLSNLSVPMWAVMGTALSQLNGLTTLDVSNNQLECLDESEWDAFCQMITQCPSLQMVKMGPLSPERVAALQQLLAPRAVPFKSSPRLLLTELQVVDETGTSRVCGNGVEACYPMAVVEILPSAPSKDDAYLSHNHYEETASCTF